MGLMKIAEYAEQEGISAQSVYKRIKKGTLKQETVNGIKHVKIEEDIQPDSPSNSTNVKPIKPGETSKKLQQANKQINDLEIKVAVLEERVSGKDEIIDTLTQQHENVVKALGDRAEDLGKAVATIAHIKTGPQDQLESKQQEETIDKIKPVEQLGLKHWFKRGLFLGLMSIAGVGVVFLCMWAFPDIVSWFKVLV